MPIQPLTPIEAIKAQIQKNIAKNERVVIRNLRYVGEQCVNYAREHGTYTDQTGNLRSSVGYILVKNGTIIDASMIELNTAQQEAQKFIDELVRNYSHGIVLIVVAGMNYAASVEARGYDVITGSELEAGRLVPKMMKQLGFKLR